MFNKDKFHNQLALHLGYGLILNDKRCHIKIDDNSEPPIVTIEVVDSSAKIEFIASDEISEVLDKMKHDEQMKALGMDDEINTIINVAHSAYIESTKELTNF